MSNIFEKAYFGKTYKTRDDKKAIYHWYDNEHLHAHHLIIEDGEEVNCHDDGKNICNDYPTSRDIVSEFEETINEKELAELAEREYPSNYHITKLIMKDMQRAYKAGYRKAKYMK